MLQYLINATAIWLLSLLIFDMVLRRQSMHGYNRIYLLITLFAGLLLPLVPLRNSSLVYQQLPATTVGLLPATQVVKEVTNSAANTPQQTPWLLIVYLMGMSASLTLLALEIIKLIRLSRNAVVSQDGKWTIIETGKDHAPFSLMHRLYVTSQQQYTNDEWQMILAHEGRHTTLLHVADHIMLHITRIVLWFHPLIYVYHRRLLMVHEYQADANAEEPTTYGRFLVEQAVFHAAPSITHSLNYSPIKNRINMLTKNKTKNQPLRMLVILPMLAVATGCFTKEATKRTFERKGNEITYNGNKFKMSEPKTDTIMLMDPISGDTMTQTMTSVPKPIEMNGQKIYSSPEATPPAYLAGSTTLEDAVNKIASTELSALPDGDYWIDMNNVVVSESGKVAFYEFRGVRRVTARSLTTVGADSTRKLGAAIDNVLNDVPAMKPATANGKNVPSLLETKFDHPIFHVQDHKVTFGNPSNM
ncbi:MAG: hypothetical protein KF744_00225 [Taibaiella sp.]|nr:hypothetical protein [Taibaiella sp.]